MAEHFDALTDDQISSIYAQLEIEWHQNLEHRGVKLPGLVRGGEFSKNALVLVYLYHKINQTVNKTELTQYMQDRFPDTNDVQQARHLATGHGWYIVSGTRGSAEGARLGLSRGEYRLVSVEEPFPGFNARQAQEPHEDGGYPFPARDPVDGSFFETGESSVDIDEITRALEEAGQVVLYGPPGTGKTHLALYLAQKISGSRYEVVQFHPSYSYEDFVEGIAVRPTDDGSRVTYESETRIFRQLCEEAARVQDQNAYIVLVIDEINRGDLGRVFGELIFGLEYRDFPVRTSLLEAPLAIPSNLLIIGTMNSVDRSIALLDFALRRRFKFIPVTPDPGILRQWLAARSHGVTPENQRLILDAFETINAQITRDREKLGPQYQLGHTYFFVRDGASLERQWRYAIIPLLEEYLQFNEQDLAPYEYRQVIRPLGER